MLPKIGAALSKFVTPVASASGRITERREREAPSGGPGLKRHATKEFVRVVPPPAEARDREGVPHAPEAKAPTPLPVPSVASAFLQLFSLLQKSARKMRSLGQLSYTASIRRQRKGGRTRKGTLIDEKIE